MSEQRRPSFEEGMEALDRFDAASAATSAGDLDPDEKEAFIDIMGRDAADEAFGNCSYPTYCKFYGENPSFCDRICDESVWDQV